MRKSTRNKHLLSLATNVFYSGSLTATFFVNVSNILVELDVFPHHYQKNINHLDREQKAIYYLLVTATMIFFLALLKSFARLMSRVYKISYKEYGCWKTTRVGKATNFILAIVAAFYCASLFSFLTGSIVYIISESLPSAMACSFILFLGSILAQYALFTHSNEPTASSKLQLQQANKNDHCLGYLSLTAASLDATNNTILYINSARIFCNDYIPFLTISLKLSDNSTRDNIIFSSLVFLIGIVCYNVVKISYKNLLRQLLNVNNKKKLLPCSCSAALFRIDERKNNKRILNVAKFYLGVIKSFISACAINRLISSYIHTDNHLVANVYVAGIPTLLTLYANFMGRLALYFGSKHKEGVDHQQKNLINFDDNDEFPIIIDIDENNTRDSSVGNIPLKLTH